MTPDEEAKIRARVAEQKAQLRALEDEVARLARAHATPVMLAMLRGLVEMVCAAQGAAFVDIFKTKFYKGVLLMLREKGIS